MNDGLNIAIVGAGIGGLAAAIALRARGMNVSVFEEAASPREAGAGISIPPNAANLLKRTGLRDAIEKITTRSQGLTLRTSRGEAVPTPPRPPRCGAIRSIASNLLNMLLDVVGETVIFGHRCVAVDETEHGSATDFCQWCRLRCGFGHRCRRHPFDGTAHDRLDGEPDQRRHRGLQRPRTNAKTLRGSRTAGAEYVDGAGP